MAGFSLQDLSPVSVLARYTADFSGFRWFTDLRVMLLVAGLKLLDLFGVGLPSWGVGTRSGGSRPIA